MRLSGTGIATVLVLVLTACGSSGGAGAQSPGGAGSGAGGAPSGGSAGAGAGAVGAAGAPAPPQHVVGACDKLGDAGTLENITPAALNFAHWCNPGSAACSAPGAISTYGAHGLAIDPNNAGTVYLGTHGLGFWKTTDCGATWVKIDTGAHQMEIDSGRNWTIVIDPSNSQVLYTTPGYGAEGLYKSVNGGVDWQSIFTPDIVPSLPYGGFIETIAMDPTNTQHLVVSFHIDCKNGPGGADWACFAESADAGTSWKLLPSAQHWSEGDGQTLIDSKTWFFSNGGDGIWRTTNAGSSWDKVYSGKASGHVFTGADKNFYVAGQPMVQSSDGVKWTPLPGSPDGSSVNGSDPIASDGVQLFTSGGQYGGGEPASGWYASAPLSDPTMWTPLFKPVTMSNGGSTIVYDPDHKVLYSANLTAGLWRARVE
jgi:hypothetical protein